MTAFLESTAYIDCLEPSIQHLAQELSSNADSQFEVASRCFLWVRDEITHSLDHKQDPVTCRASEVLRYRTGYCFAKSHLLAALLRANQIPAGLCYQRLRMDADGKRFCLHGYIALKLPKHEWFRVDPRGNKPGVECGFNPPTEQLAFSCDEEGERCLTEIYAEPLPTVVQLLTSSHGYQEVADRLEETDVGAA